MSYFEVYVCHMAKRTNKSIAEILIPIEVSSSPPITNDNDLLLSSSLERKITLATEGFTTSKFCELILRDRNRLSKENALTVCDYIIAMKREVNPKANYHKNYNPVLSELSKAVGIAKKFKDMTRDDILLSYIDKCRKPENEDPLHKWIGSYNTKCIYYLDFSSGCIILILTIQKEEMNYQHKRESLNVSWIFLS